MREGVVASFEINAALNLLVNDRFYTITIWIEDKRCVIIFAIFGVQS